jgi:hypothetical protein
MKRKHIATAKCRILRSYLALGDSPTAHIFSIKLRIMKKINILQYLLILSAILIQTNCKKETPSNGGSIVNPPSPPPLSTNTGPTAYAGEDLLVFLPANFSTLFGSVSYDQTNIIRTIRWDKISGPSSLVIEHPDSLSTKLSNLESGVYKFELTVTDTRGRMDKDTNTVIVGEFPANPQEKIFSNQSWSCPWECGLGIANVYSHIPLGHVFKVFLKRDGSASWLEIPHWRSSSAIEYGYSFYHGDLWVSTNNASGTSDLKISY